MEDYFSMTERFTFIEVPGEMGIQDELSGDVLVLMHDDANSKGFVISIINLLNNLHNEHQQLIKDYNEHIWKVRRKWE